MPLSYRSADGQLYVITPQDWHAATPNEQLAFETTPFQAAAQQGVRNFRELGGMLGQLLNFSGVGTRPHPGDPLIQQAQASAEEVAPLAENQPGALLAGRLLLDPFAAAGFAGAGGRLLGAAGRAAAGPRMAERVAAGIGAAAEAARPVSGRLGGLPGSVEGGEDLRNLWEGLTKPVPLTPQQRALLPEAARLGLEIPESRAAGLEGVAILEESGPLGRLRLSQMRARNLNVVADKALKAMGLPEGTPLTADALGGAVDAHRELLEATAEKIGNLAIPEELKARFVALNKTSPLLGLSEGASMDGTQAMSMMSQLGKSLRAARDPVTFEYVRDTQAALGSLISDALGPTDQALWKLTLQQYKNRIAVESAFNDKGELMLAQLGRKFRSMYQGPYVRQLLGTEGRSKGLTTETVDMLRATKVLNAFGSFFPNSGTATRQAYLEILKHPIAAAREYGQEQVLSHFLTRLGRPPGPPPASPAVPVPGQ